MLKLRESLETLQPYAVEEQRFPIMLDANESAVNLPPAVLKEVAGTLASLDFNRYPDIGMTTLRKQIAANFAVTMEHVLLGSGSSAILEILCYVFGGGRSIVFPYPSFSMYGTYAKMADSKGVPVQLGQGFRLDREAMLAAAEKENAGLIIICNPNNPTGTLTPLADIEYILAGAKCPVVVDEAYYEFYGGGSAVELQEKYPQLIVARTFSKAYGLASARVGYMLAAPEIVRMAGLGFTPYHISALSLATAEVVYKHKNDFQPIIRQAVGERQRIAGELASLEGIEVYPSVTNFILFKAEDAAGLAKYLAGRNIGVRTFGNAARLDNCIRVSMGTVEENTAFINIVREYLKR